MNERGFGLIPLDEAEYNSIPLAMAPPGGVLPASFDLSADMPPVRHQGPQDSCVGWAVAYALRTFIERRGQRWDVTSPERQFSPAFVFNQSARGTCRGGMSYVAALNILREQGAATMAVMPYNEGDCASQPSAEARRQAQVYRVAMWRRVNVQDPAEVKAQLAGGFPVLVAVVTDKGFVNLGRDEIWRSKGETAGFHAVTLVGYDDGRRAFKLINSWGREWGTDGYGWIGYDLFPRVTREAYVVAPFNTPTEPPPIEVVTRPTPTEAVTHPTITPPPPTPLPVREAYIQIMDVAHNIRAGDGSFGMNVRLRYTLKNYAGHRGQIALHFWFPDNQPVKAASEHYRDVYNNAASGPPLFTIERDDYTNYEFTHFVPYAALSVPRGQVAWDGQREQYQPRRTDMNVVADLYVDNFGIAQSNAVLFSVNQ